MTSRNVICFLQSIG